VGERREPPAATLRRGARPGELPLPLERRPSRGPVFVGTSGWAYRGWRAHLYGDVPARRWLEAASRAFDTLEINASFYTQIAPATYARWRTEVPADFRFTLKGHRFVTHYKRLRDCADSVIRLRDQSAPLGASLAAVVWQLPSNFELDLARLEDFLGALREWPTRHALELRHRSWFVPAVADRLRAANVAVCLGDAPDFPMWREVTADFVYVRLHGHTRKYASSYSASSLRRWADDALRWAAAGRDVYIHLDNDAEGHAVRNARALRALLDADARTSDDGNPGLSRTGTLPASHGVMAQGSKTKYTAKQKRQARHIEEGAKKRGYSAKRAAQIGYATVNKQDHGGKKSGSGRGKKRNTASSRIGGKTSHSGGTHRNHAKTGRATSKRGGSRAAHARAGRAAHRT